MRGSNQVSTTQSTKAMPTMIHIRRIARAGSFFFFFGCVGFGNSLSQRQQT
jgi:hypothetical protein